MENFIYKICSMDEWNDAEKVGEFRGSKKEQLNSTLKKYYINQGKLILLKVEVSNLKNLKWERLQTEEAFPHLYSVLNLKNIKKTFEILLNKDGTHKLPSYL